MREVHNIFFMASDGLGILILLFLGLVVFCMIIGAFAGPQSSVGVAGQIDSAAKTLVVP